MLIGLCFARSPSIAPAAAAHLKLKGPAPRLVAAICNGSDAYPTTMTAPDLAAFAVGSDLVRAVHYVPEYVDQATEERLITQISAAKAKWTQVRARDQRDRVFDSPLSMPCPPRADPVPPPRPAALWTSPAKPRRHRTPEGGPDPHPPAPVAGGGGPGAAGPLAALWADDAVNWLQRQPRVGQRIQARRGHPAPRGWPAVSPGGRHPVPGSAGGAEVLAQAGGRCGRAGHRLLLLLLLRAACLREAAEPLHASSRRHRVCCRPGGRSHVPLTQDHAAVHLVRAGGTGGQPPVLSLLLEPRSLLIFSEEAYTHCLHGIDEASAPAHVGWCSLRHQVCWARKRRAAGTSQHVTALRLPSAGGCTGRPSTRVSSALVCRCLRRPWTPPCAICTSAASSAPGPARAQRQRPQSQPAATALPARPQRARRCMMAVCGRRCRAPASGCH